MRFFRVSLRGALVLMTLAAGFCYWRDRPRQIAKRFESLSNSGDYRAANQLVIRHGYKYGNSPTIFPEWKVELGEQTAGNWFCGRYPLSMRGRLSGQSYSIQAEATATGIRCPDRWKLDRPPTI